MADQKYHNHALNRWASSHGWYAIEVISRLEEQRKFKLRKNRWIVGLTFAWLGGCRVHSRDYERRSDRSAAQMRMSMIGLMLRGLAGERHKVPFHYPRPIKAIADDLGGRRSPLGAAASDSKAFRLRDTPIIILATFGAS